LKPLIDPLRYHDSPLIQKKFVSPIENSGTSVFERTSKENKDIKGKKSNEFIISVAKLARRNS